MSGWGPLTDRNLINNDQEWPVDIQDLYEKFNGVSYKLQTLRDQGYDLILLQFYPPNGSLYENATELESIINQVNQIKNDNGSFEENVIIGYSSGALTSKLALLRMEKEHLENNGPHHHSKLYISFEGEHQGAAIPLSIQNSISELQENQSYLYTLLDWFALYGLNYILNAPQSQQILKYYHTRTGNPTNPGQGESQLRTTFVDYISNRNHIKNSFNPNYPSFTRNSSISNGQNTSDINGSTSNHPPYVTTENFNWFKEFGVVKRLETYFNQSGGNTIYKRQRWIWGWKVKSEKVTGSNCLVLDNAPAGDFETFSNPLKSVVSKALDPYIIGSPTPGLGNTQYGFTPILFIHDIRNFNPALTNYRMDYNFRANHLMYQDKVKADLGNVINSSNFFGYPHLKYPNSHYSSFTPFDAIFTSPENTVHISSGRIGELSPGYYEEDVFHIETDIKDSLEKFILMEADVYDGNIYIQNKKYGWNARTNYIYKADVKCEKELFLGQNVTQRTDFKEVEMWNNSDIYLQAGDAVHFRPGVHIQSGAKLHAKIDPLVCSTFISYFKSQNGRDSEQNKLGVESNKIQDEMLTKESISTIEVYPNPTTGLIYIEAKNENSALHYIFVYSIDGRLVKQSVVSGDKFSLHLDKGIYIIKIENQGLWHTKKVIVY